MYSLSLGRILNFFTISEEARKDAGRKYPDGWYLEMLVVEGSMKGAGLGSKMINDAVVPYVSRHGGKNLALITNTESICWFCGKNGFTIFSNEGQKNQELESCEKDRGTGYFANIMNPFAPFVTRKFGGIARLDLPIDMIAPSHGVVWRGHPEKIVRKYAEWADGCQKNQVTVAYETLWNGTKALAYAVADEIHRLSPDTVVKVYNIARTGKNELMTEVFRSKAVAVGSPTCVNEILTSVSAFLSFAGNLKFRNKKADAFCCYGWSGEGGEPSERMSCLCGF